MWEENTYKEQEVKKFMRRNFIHELLFYAIWTEIFKHTWENYYYNLPQLYNWRFWIMQRLYSWRNIPNYRKLPYSWYFPSKKNIINKEILQLLIKHSKVDKANAESKRIDININQPQYCLTTATLRTDRTRARWLHSLVRHFVQCDWEAQIHPPE